MKVNGIIAEYNPFHNGHKYHLNDAKQRNNADYTIIAMSGNFVQRGAPALLDKYKRAEMALSCGADLVLELPTYYAASSAEFFATGAVALLDKTGVVDTLCFGSECGNLSILSRLADILLEEPEGFVNALRHYLRLGFSYPNARTWALLQYDPQLSDYKDVLSTPNNILGIEYLKALKRRSSKIVPDTSLRVGADYHDKRMGENQCSALAIRQAVFSRQDFEFLESQMPERAYKIMIDSLREGTAVHINDFSSVLHYKLLQEKEEGYTRYLDISSDLSDRIRNNLYQFSSFCSFCDLLKSKDMTYARISRCLLHILLNMNKATMETYRELDYVPYARVLGFRKDAAPLLTALKANSSIPIITKLADAKNQLDEKAYAILQNDIRMNDIYSSTAAIKTRQPMINEFSTPLVII